MLDLIEDPQLPFFVQWLCDPGQHPSAGGRPDLRLQRMEIGGDANTVAAWLGEPSHHPLDGIEVDWLDDDAPGLQAVHVTTPHGSVRLD